MIEIIAGAKGKGKTKYLLDGANEAVKSANGNIVYIDKNHSSMVELSNKVRLINATDYPTANADEFIGFLCGIISQDYDLEAVYVDSFLTVANVCDACLEDTFAKLAKVSEKYNVKFVLSVSKNEADLPESVKKDIVVAL